MIEHLKVEQEPSWAAEEGTEAHELAAQYIAGKLDADLFTLLGSVRTSASGRNFTVEYEMVSAILSYAAVVYAEQGETGIVEVESWLESALHPQLAGTSDALVWQEERQHLTIIDFKYGKGVVVEPDSPQLLYYGALALERYGRAQTVDLVIVQPRIPHPQGIVRRFSTTAEAVNSWFVATLLPAFAAAKYESDAPLKTGSWCRWCPAKNQCPQHLGEIAGFEQNALLTPADKLDNETLGTLLTWSEKVAAYASTLQEEAYKRARRGEQVRGYKLVRKLARRTWRDGADVQLRRTYGDEAFEPAKLKSPAQIEKLDGGKDVTKEWALQPDAGLTLAKEEDRREAVGGGSGALEAFMDQGAV